MVCQKDSKNKIVGYKKWRDMIKLKRLSTRILAFILALAMVFASMSLMPDIGVQEVSAADSSVIYTWPASVKYLYASGGAKGRWGDYVPDHVRNSHFGQDFSFNVKQLDIVAAADGKVVKVGNESLGYGHFVLIQHANMQVTLYAHLTSVCVSKGQSLKRGQKVGVSVAGYSSGKTNGTCMHFGIYKSLADKDKEYRGYVASAISVDPLKYLKKIDGLKYSPCKSHNWNTSTGDCTMCGVAFVDKGSVDTSCKTVVASKVYKMSKADYIRVYPNASAKKSKSDKQSAGSYVKVLGSSGSFYKVQYTTGGEKGFVDKTSVTTYTPTKAGSSISGSISGFTVKKGSSHVIKGTAKSNYPLKSVEVSVGGLSSTKNYSDSIAKSLTIDGSSIDNNIKIAKLVELGSYTMTMVITDISGNSKSYTATVNVNGSVKMPKITKANKSAGKYTITISQGGQGGKIEYYINGGTKKTSSSDSLKIDKSATSAETVTVKARVVKGSDASGWKTEPFKIGKVGEPTINVTQQGSKGKVTISAQSGAAIKYAKNGGSTYSAYSTPLYLADGESISAYATLSGFANSDKSTVEVGLTEPDTPVVKNLNGDTKVAAGKGISLGWSADSKAEGYTAVLHAADTDEILETQQLTKNSAEFKMETPGKYYVIVSAKNDIGVSLDSEPVNIQAMDKLTVKFVAGTDESDEVYQQIKADYGSKLSEVLGAALAEPSKRGYSFTGWKNLNSEVVSKNAYYSDIVKDDITYAAIFEKNKYKVKIYDPYGKFIETQTVEFGDSVDIEKVRERAESQLKTGYVISDWVVTSAEDGASECNYQSVDSDMELRAVASWENAELPVIADVEFAEADTTGKFINTRVKLSTWEEQDLSFYLVASLQMQDAATGVEKTIYADRKIVYLDACDAEDANASETTVSMRLKADGQDVKSVKVVAVQCNGDMTTGSTYSDAASAPVTIKNRYTEWSEWTTTVPESVEGRNIERKTQYRYSDTETTASGYDTLSGWTKQSTATLSTTYGGYRTTKPSESTSTTSDCKTVVSAVGTSAYCTYGWYTNDKQKCWKATNDGYYPNKLKVYSSVSLGSSGYKNDTDGSYYVPRTIKTGTGSKLGTIYLMKYSGDAISSFTAGANLGYTFLWPDEKVTIYRAKTVKTRNTFTRQGAWSAWSDTEPAAKSGRKIETRTVYHYQDKILEEAGSGVTDLSGDETYHYSGALDNISEDLSGKNATVMVYQAHNTDPNKYQMQYLGQTKLGTGNSYDISFITKEKPTSETGNFIVALGVQGTTGLVNVGVIESPAPEYNVEIYYRDQDGEKHVIAEDIKVREHKDIDVSAIEIPEVNGYYFAGWVGRTTDITGEICDSEGNYSLEACYRPLPASVIFIDWVNQTAEFSDTVFTGDKVSLPESVESVDGYRFKGWKLEDGTVVDPAETPEVTVTGNMMITAEYAVDQFNVRFIGVDGTVVSEQTLKYGESANPPGYSLPDGVIGEFVGWSTKYYWWNVECDVDVHPIISYMETSKTPEIRIEYDDSLDERFVVIECEDENAEIFYSVNGDDEITADDVNEAGTAVAGEESKSQVMKYTEPIPVSSLAPEAEPDGDIDEEEPFELCAVAVVPDMNVSETISKLVSLNLEYDDADDADDAFDEWQLVGEYDVKVSAGKDVDVKLNIDNNPGLCGYDILIDADKETFYADGDEYGNPVVSGGAVSKGGTLNAEESNEGWRTVWDSIDPATENGNLFSMKLHVDEEKETGIETIRVYYAPARTVDADFEGINFEQINEEGFSAEIMSDANIAVDSLDISLNRTSYTFEGNAIEPTVTIDGLKEGQDFTVSYENNINSGTAKAVVTGIGDYAGTVEKEFTIIPANIANADVAAIGDQVVTGSAIEPELDVSYGDVHLEKDVDYTAAFQNNTETGTATVKITGQGNFTGLQSINFNIVETAESRLAEAQQAIEGLTNEKAELEDAIQKAEADLTAAEEARAKAEEAKAKAEEDLEKATTDKETAEQALAEADMALEKAEQDIEAAKQAKAKAEADLRETEAALTQAKAELEAAKAEIASLKDELATKKVDVKFVTMGVLKDKTYTGANLTQALSVKFNGMTLEKGKDYSVAYSSNKNVGKAKVTVTGLGDYTGTVSETFKINPKGTSVFRLTAAQKGFTVKWKKQTAKMSTSRITGYQIRYSTKSSMKSAKTVTISGYSKYSKKVAKLKAKKKYYVQVRTYKTVSGIKYYSSWSAKKTVTTK